MILQPHCHQEEESHLRMETAHRRRSWKTEREELDPGGMAGAPESSCT